MGDPILTPIVGTAIVGFLLFGWLKYSLEKSLQSVDQVPVLSAQATENQRNIAVLDARITSLDTEYRSLTGNQIRHETNIEELRRNMARMEARFDKLEQKIDAILEKLP
jgi:septal ring factor EnvC (AmiA/AmiB activator)